MIAVIADIHGNVWALEAVLKELDRLHPSQVVVAGDLALGGPKPAECVALIRRRGYPTIRGNTDEWLTKAPARVTDPISWTSAKLSEEDREFLAALPFLWRHNDETGEVAVIHATPWSIGDVVRPDAPEHEARRMVEETRAAAVVYGHIHHAYIREVVGKLLVNTGSVGLPFDGDWRASFVTLSSEGGRWKARIHRVAYDREMALSASRKTDNPERDRFIKRLETAAF